MKKIIKILTLFSTIVCFTLMISACSDKTIPNGIELTAKEGSISSEGLVLIIKNNSDKYSYGFGNDFDLEHYKNNEWVAVPYINGGHSITAIGLCLRPNTSREFTTNFKNTWGDLPAGNYRIVKHFDKTSLNDNSKVIAAYSCGKTAERNIFVKIMSKISEKLVTCLIAAGVVNDMEFIDIKNDYPV